MIKFIIIITVLLATASLINAQPPELFSKTWKMEKIITVYPRVTNTLFHKDSATNTLNLSSLNYTFFNNGTYSLQSDSTSSLGTWGLNAAGDSATIDTITYKLIELSATHFTTRGFTLQIADTLGTVDTAFTYVVLYPAASLPVKLISFTGQYANSLVKLNWSTAEEKQSKEFQVQYSADGATFETINVVPAKVNAAIETDYVLNTGRYQTGKNYYRLKQVDLDGNSELSPIVIISIGALRQSTISLSPNPASNKINLSISQPVAGKLQMVLTTVAGQQVWNTTIPVNTVNSTVFLPSLSKGVYIVTIINSKGEKMLYNKLVIQ